MVQITYYHDAIRSKDWLIICNWYENDIVNSRRKVSMKNGGRHKVKLPVYERYECKCQEEGTIQLTAGLPDIIRASETHIPREAFRVPQMSLALSM